MPAVRESHSKKAMLVKLALAVVVLGGVAVALLQGVDLRGRINEVLQWVRSLGPAPFFCAMVVLPALGFPLLAFSLSAAPIFAPQLGLGWVLVLVVASLAGNLVLSYWLSRYAIRPLLEGLIKRFGYGLPEVAEDDHMSLTLLVRITPGPPFFVQSYLLGLAGVPFWTYLWVSWLISSIYGIAVVVFGDSLMQGSGKVVVLALSIFIAIGVGAQWVRRRYQRRKAARV